MSLAPSELESMDGYTATCGVCHTGLIFFYVDPVDSLDGKTIYEPEWGQWAHTELTLGETAGHTAQPIGDTIAPPQNRRA